MDAQQHQQQKRGTSEKESLSKKREGPETCKHRYLYPMQKLVCHCSTPICWKGVNTRVRNARVFAIGSARRSSVAESSIDQRQETKSFYLELDRASGASDEGKPTCLPATFGLKRHSVKCIDLCGPAAVVLPLVWLLLSFALLWI